ncbi:Aminotransferase, class IV [Penicillium occitanis (nom. inval.)]|nr:hypothetical protein PENOC_058320 [Penicillium occitanis (nom. inval.)]PCH07332.1 Aminotransferase, class IV [Penicillium occitanis (nom. inval.)]
MAFPPEPTDSVDWKSLGFSISDVNGHIEAKWSSKTGTWGPPTFVTDPYIRLHGLAPALNYGQQAYEGLKALRTADNQILIFRPQKNAARFAHSASFISIPAVPEELFVECVHAAVALNAEYVPPHETGAAMYIRPLIFGSGPELRSQPPAEFTLCVYVNPVGTYHGAHPVKALVMEEYHRAAPKGTGSAKIGGNYAPVMRWQKQAAEQGYGITLHLDAKTESEIDEFSSSGFIGVKTDKENNITLVLTNSKNIIDSITVDSCLGIGKSLGWNVEVRPIKYEEVGSFSEVLAAGTAAALLPIRSITRPSTSETVSYIDDSSEEPGPVCSILLSTLKGIQSGKMKDTFGWTYPVHGVDATQYAS